MREREGELKQQARNTKTDNDSAGFGLHPVYVMWMCASGKKVELAGLGPLDGGTSERRTDAKWSHGRQMPSHQQPKWSRHTSTASNSKK